MSRRRPLDPLVQQTLFAKLRARAARGGTVFFSSHTLSEVEALCDRVAILRAGELVANESLDALRTRARRIITLEFTQPIAAAPPPCLQIETRDDRRWRGTLRGSVTELTAWCANQPLADVLIEKPDLTELFRQYYDREGVA